MGGLALVHGTLALLDGPEASLEFGLVRLDCRRPFVKGPLPFHRRRFQGLELLSVPLRAIPLLLQRRVLGLRLLPHRVGLATETVVLCNERGPLLLELCPQKLHLLAPLVHRVAARFERDPSLLDGLLAIAETPLVLRELFLTLVDLCLEARHLVLHALEVGGLFIQLPAALGRV